MVKEHSSTMLSVTAAPLAHTRTRTQMLSLFRNWYAVHRDAAGNVRASKCGRVLQSMLRQRKVQHVALRLAQSGH